MRSNRSQTMSVDNDGEVSMRDLMTEVVDAPDAATNALPHVVKGELSQATPDVAPGESVTVKQTSICTPLTVNRHGGSSVNFANTEGQKPQKSLFEVLLNESLTGREGLMGSRNICEGSQRHPTMYGNFIGKHTVLTDDGFPYSVCSPPSSDYHLCASDLFFRANREVSGVAGGTTAGKARPEEVAQTESVLLEGHSHNTLKQGASQTSNSPQAEDILHEKIIMEHFSALSSDLRRLEILHNYVEQYLLPFEGNRSFTGDTWDEVKSIGPSRTCCGIHFDRSRVSLHIILFWKQYRFFFCSFLFRFLCIFFFWVIMYCLVSRPSFSPGGLYFDTFATVFFSGIVGTIVSKIIRIPSLVCVTAAGILYNNVPSTGFLTSGITPTMYVFAGMFGLSVGVLRAGLSLNVILFKKKILRYLLFGFLPMIAETTVHAVMCKFLFGYPNFIWAFLQGFIVSAIAPSVVVPILINMQRKGYNIRDGPPMMLLSSISIDTSFCVWAIQFLLAIEFNTMNMNLAIIIGIVQIIVGLVVGVLLGFMTFFFVFYVLFLEAEKITLADGSISRMTVRHAMHVRYLSITFIMLLSFACLSFGRYISCLGGSAVCAMTMATVFNFLCVRGGTPEHIRVMAEMSQTLTTVWDYIAMPSLFGFTGANVNVHELFTPGYIGLGLGVIAAGLFTRFFFAMLTPLIVRMSFTWREVLFCGIGWLGKGSVQGALGSVALLYAQQELQQATTPEEIASANERVVYGQTVKNTAILSVLIACPLCSILLSCFAHKLLKHNSEALEPATDPKEK